MILRDGIGPYFNQVTNNCIPISPYVITKVISKTATDINADFTTIVLTLTDQGSKPTLILSCAHFDISNLQCDFNKRFRFQPSSDTTTFVHSIRIFDHDAFVTACYGLLIYFTETLLSRCTVQIHQLVVQYLHIGQAITY